MQKKIQGNNVDVLNFYSVVSLCFGDQVGQIFSIVFLFLMYRLKTESNWSVLNTELT